MRPYERAIYREQSLIEFKRNPLIEALPELMDSEQILERLTKIPPYNRSQRLLSARERMQHCERLRQFHQPGMYDLDIAYKVARCIRWGWSGPSLPAWSDQQGTPHTDGTVRDTRSDPW